MPYVIDVDRSFENHVLVTLKGGHKIFGSYIPLADSIYYEDEYIFVVPCFLSPIDSDCVFIGGGDMNSRVGDKVHIPGDINASYRANPDNIVNSHGKMLRNICKNHNCCLLNNLNYDEKIFDGDFTFEKAGSKSQNDACITNVSGLRSVESFSIHDISFNFSDHKPISVSLKIPILAGVKSSLVAEDILTNSCDKSIKRQRKINSENVDWKAYETIVNLKLHNIAETINGEGYFIENVEKTVNEVDTALYNTALF